MYPALCSLYTLERSTHVMNRLVHSHQVVQRRNFVTLLYEHMKRPNGAASVGSRLWNLFSFCKTRSRSWSSNANKPDEQYSASLLGECRVQFFFVLLYTTYSKSAAKLDQDFYTALVVGGSRSTLPAPPLHVTLCLLYKAHHPGSLRRFEVLLLPSFRKPYRPSRSHPTRGTGTWPCAAKYCSETSSCTRTEARTAVQKLLKAHPLRFDLNTRSKFSRLAKKSATIQVMHYTCSFAPETTIRLLKIPFSSLASTLTTGTMRHITVSFVQITDQTFDKIQSSFSRKKRTSIFGKKCNSNFLKVALILLTRQHFSLYIEQQLA